MAYAERARLRAELNAAVEGGRRRTRGGAGHAARRGTIREVLKRLDKRELTIVLARHFAERPRTLAAVSKKLGLSRERVRQLESRAIAKLRLAVLELAEAHSAT